MSVPVIDCHTHAYPEALAADPAGWARARGEAHWSALVAPPDGRASLQGWVTPKRMLADMDAAGVERAVLLGWYWEHQDTCAWHNAWLADCVREAPDRFVAFASVQPRDGERALEDLKRAVDAGLTGVGEVFPAAQGFSMQDPAWARIVSFAAANKLPLNLHVPEPVGRAYPGRVDAPLADYQWLAEAFPDAQFIFAHWGGLLPFYELNSACRRALRNVHYDTSASPLLYAPRVFRAVVDAVGPEKILFGSDYPLRLYPRKDPECSFARFLDEVRGSGLTDSELSLILHENARRLLRLPCPHGP